MIFQHLKFALRQFLRHRGYTAIHLVGLATGLAACILLVQYVGYELSFDRFHTKADHIYRVVNARYQEGELVQEGTITYPTIGKTLAADFPEITNHTRLFLGGSGNTIVRVNNEIYEVKRGFYVSSSFLDLFDFPLLAAKTDSLFVAPQEMIITRQQADTWFPNLQGNYHTLLGEMIQVDQEEEFYEVVGVLDELPPNTHFNFDCLLSYASIINYFGEAADNSWTWSNFHHYVELDPKADPAALQAKFGGFSERYFRGTEVSGNLEQFYLQPLTEAHLHSSHLEYELGRTTNSNVVWALLAIAFLILVIAWINYANLTIARSLERAQEVGVRKVVGANRRQLIGQFLAESFLANGISAVLALLLVGASKSTLQRYLGIDIGTLPLHETLGQQPLLAVGLISLFSIGLLLAALYPAWVLSRPNLSTTLKGSFTQQRGTKTLRNSLVVFQFATSVALIAGTLMIYRQVNYLQLQDLGVHLDQVVVLNAPELTDWDSTFIDRMDVFKQALVDLPGVKTACTSSNMPGERTGRIFKTTVPSAPDQVAKTMSFIQADYDYATTFELPILAGRDLARLDHSHNWNALNTVLINEVAVAHLGFASKEEAVGQIIETNGKPWTIVGVFADFHQQSLHTAIEPLLIQPIYNTLNELAIRLDTRQVDQTLVALEETYASYFPGNTFNYHFLDESFAEQYASDQQFARILSGFTGLAIFIACLGLIGLAAYTTRLRMKEVSIRKVLGAAQWNILYLLSKDFLILIFPAILIGLPLAWWGIQRWLANYAFQIPTTWQVYVLAALASFVLAALTAGYFAWRASTSNPIQHLSRE
ncbi:MAG: ABC transporter permease [Bacteroidota bacterium]